MKSLAQILNEGKILDLPGIKKIRHYTTLTGLLNIMKDGYIMPNESHGDNDWWKFDIGVDRVVSFVDSRYDSEIKELCYSNEMGWPMHKTQKLGLHMEEICAMIEYDYDKLPDDIKRQSTIIKLLETIVPDFTWQWNRLCEIAEDYKENENNLKNYWPNFILNSKKHKADLLDIITRDNLKPYTKEEEDKLLEYAIKRKTVPMLNMMLAHGYHKKDEKKDFLRLGQDTPISFLDYIARHVTGTDRREIPIEIRIAAKMPLDIPGCTIHYFDGVGQAVSENEDQYDEYDELVEVIENTRYNIVYHTAYDECKI